MTLVLLTTGLSGCTSNSNNTSKTNEQKIIGQWTATLPDIQKTVAMTFFTNKSYSETIDLTIVWGTYTITNETIVLIMSGEVHTVAYSFSNNYNTLTLYETDDGGTGELYLVLTRQ